MHNTSQQAHTPSPLLLDSFCCSKVHTHTLTLHQRAHWYIAPEGAWSTLWWFHLCLGILGGGE